MRGRIEPLTIGERVAFYRRRCGQSQEVLAGLVGRTEDWLSRVENNRIELDRLSVIRRLADALDVSVGKLVAEPTVLDWTADSGTRTVPALRSVLMDYHQVAPLPVGALGESNREPLSLDALQRDIGQVFDAYQASRPRPWSTPRPPTGHRPGLRRLPGLSVRLRHQPSAPRPV